MGNVRLHAEPERVPVHDTLYMQSRQTPSSWQPRVRHEIIMLHSVGLLIPIKNNREAEAYGILCFPS